MNSRADTPRIDLFRMLSPFRRLPKDDFTIELGTLLYGFGLGLIINFSDFGESSQLISLAKSIVTIFLSIRMFGIARRVQLHANSKDEIK